MNPTFMPSQLSQFEAQLAVLSAALVQQDPAELQATASALQTLAVALSAVLPHMAVELKTNPDAQRRARAVAAQLVSLRVGVLRQKSGVERALAALIPATQHGTYGVQSAVSGYQTYGSAGRKSGEFTAFAA